MSKPRVLDLFCGSGGAAMGYHLAGFEVVGVDIRDMPRYPFEFIKADAFEVFQEIGDQFDLIHASPPCQGYSVSIKTDGRWSRKQNRHKGKDEPRLIAPLKEMLRGTSYVIENVVGARNEMSNPFVLCGSMFDLKIRRHRYFEASFNPIPPKHPRCVGMTHPDAEAWIAIDPIHRDRRIYSITGKQRQTGSVEVWKTLMEMPWAVSDFDITPSLPPAYTKWLGERFKEK